jgi:hypothetical protein
MRSRVGRLFERREGVGINLCGFATPRAGEVTHLRFHVRRRRSFRAPALFLRIFVLSDLDNKTSITASNESTTTATKNTVPMILRTVICLPSVRGSRD